MGDVQCEGKVKVLTIFALALLDLVLVLYVLMTGLAVVPCPLHLENAG